MEDKEDPTPNTRPGFQGKSGWVKKAHGRVLSSYKERYISVGRTEIMVYENEDQKNCLERVDLENYDKCHEMKSGFKRKHRLVLLRSPKATNKVHDMKFQAPSAEEKEAWIKALCDGINRAKNKIFDEITVDQSSNLEHVTRSRPKGNRTRRPPTRIHMKEVADVSSDGILRLDLDLENAVMPNGTQSSSSSAVDGAQNLKASTPSPSSSETTADKPLSAITEEEDQDHKPTKALTPPTPPQTATEDGTGGEEPEKTVKPPASPSKDEEQSDTKMTKTPETSPDPKKKMPPMPPNKPLLSIIVPRDPSPTPTPPKTPAHPPTPPSKTKKPSTSTETNQEASPNEEKKDTEKDNESQDVAPTLEISQKLSLKPEHLPKSDANVEADESKAHIPVVVVSLNDSQSVNLSPLLGHRQGDDNGKKAEEKSVDSGQHSDDNSEDSTSEDALQMRDSNSGLDELDSKGSTGAVSVGLKQQICPSKGFMTWNTKPPTPIKPEAKVRSFSSGNLLYDSCDDIGGGKRLENKETDVKKLENEVAMEMEDTSKLLSRASQAQTLPKGGKNPEKLLAEALEKLKKADHVLREVKKLKLARDETHRKSW
ncbi:pleckstrin homology domain-containing family O member 2 [Periophthalmus magnuspinnatus]|uniref:pleckstrin homology domain-containing family O member 2 n=1 Tax=Periophthalmus magnuspinnatus TaxID=409849 RepID=UPI00145AA7BB|nr:pleckstrin homology domain-containing family O member 2 [Periophthalmus magnuspinnatus]